MSDTKPTNPKDNAATDRIDLSLFPDTAVVYGALAMTEGHCKYGAYNYRPGGVQAHVYVAACRRHLAKWWNGEDNDPKTQVPHLGNALSCIAILIDSIECGVLSDDRPPHVDVTRLINGARAKVKHLQDTFPSGPDRYTQAHSAGVNEKQPKSREDYPSRWLMQDDNGREWETSSEYTYERVAALFYGTKPVLRLLAGGISKQDETTCDDIPRDHAPTCPCYACAKARRDATGQWEQ